MKKMFPLSTNCRNGKYMEQNWMVRVGLMKEFLQGQINLLIQKRMAKIEEIYSLNIKGIKSVISKALRTSIGKKDYGIVTFSFFRSSFITGSHKFFIAYYEREAFAEEEPEHIWVNLSPLFAGIEEDHEEINRGLKKNFIHLLSSEVEEIRRWYMQQLYERMKVIFSAARNDFCEKNQIRFFFGGFMEEIEELK